MRTYTLSHFKGNNFKVPNQENLGWDTITQVNRYNNSRTDYMLKHRDVSVHSILYQQFYAYNHTTPAIEYFNVTLDSIYITNRELCQSLIDAIYYKANPERLKFYNNNGTLKKGFWSNLSKRVNGSVKYNITTQKMFDEALLIAERELSTTVPEYIQRYLSTWNINPVLCYITKDLVMPHQVKSVTIHGQPYLVKKDISPQDYGYTQQNMTYGRINWIHRDYMQVGTTYIHRDQLGDVVACPECGSSTYQGLITEEGCHVCRQDLGKIHTYSTKAEQIFSFKSSGKLPKNKTMFLGIELEYESKKRDEDAVKVGKLLKGHAILKNDGSISNGFEIVTAPATIDIHDPIFKNFYDKFNTLTLQAKSNTGMHIHVSKAPLNIFSLGKITEFMNNTHNKTAIEKIAGRANNTYCNQDKRSITYPLVHGTTAGARYNTFNLNPRATGEFRIFSTPVSYEEFMHKLEFAQAMTDYSKPAAVAVKSLKELTKYETFFEWIMKNRKDYPHLSNFIKGAF